MILELNERFNETTKNLIRIREIIERKLNLDEEILELLNKIADDNFNIDLDNY